METVKNRAILDSIRKTLPCRSPSAGPRRKLIFLLCLLMFVSLSISTPGCTLPRKTVEVKNLPLPISDKCEPQMRQEFLDKLNRAYVQINNNANKLLKRMALQADGNTTFRLCLDGAGIGCAIAAGALIVASPANAVWVAALNGVTAGVLAFEASTRQEGVSRDAIVRMYDKAVGDIKQAGETYLTRYEELVKETGKANNDDKWRDAAAAALSALLKYNHTVMYFPLSYGAAEDLQKLKDAQTVFEQELDKFGKMIKDLTPTPQVMQVVNPAVSNKELKKGDTFEITASVKGGKRPYTYSIFFDPQAQNPPIDAVRRKISTNGEIKEKIDLSPDAIDGYKFKIEIEDSTGQVIIYQDESMKFEIKDQ